MARIFEFPNPVDEISARMVATGVVVMVLTILVFGQWWVLGPLVFGFVARVGAGPRFSPLGLLVTRVIRPRLSIARRLVAGPPKRFAQAVGVWFSVTATVFFLTGARAAATIVLALLLAAASLEAFIGLCLGCKVFAILMRWGVIPDHVCVECANLGARPADREPVLTSRSSP